MYSTYAGAPRGGEWKHTRLSIPAYFAPPVNNHVNNTINVSSTVVVAECPCRRAVLYPFCGDVDCCVNCRLPLSLPLLQTLGQTRLIKEFLVQLARLSSSLWLATTALFTIL